MRTCRVCSSKFYPSSNNQQTCSAQCRHALEWAGGRACYLRLRPTQHVACCICGCNITVHTKKGRPRRPNRTCSEECRKLKKRREGALWLSKQRLNRTAFWVRRLQSRRRARQSTPISDRQIALERKRRKSYYWANRLEAIRKASSWYKANIDKARESSRKQSRIRRESLSDDYIIHLIAAKTALPRSVSFFPPALIAAKREQLKLKRLLKNLWQNQMT